MMKMISIIVTPTPINQSLYCCYCDSTKGRGAAFRVVGGQLTAVNLSCSYLLVAVVLVGYYRSEHIMYFAAFCYVLLRGRAIARPSCDYTVDNDDNIVGIVDNNGEFVNFHFIFT